MRARLEMLQKNHKRLLCISVVDGGARAQRLGRKEGDTAFNCHPPAKNLPKRFLSLYDSMRPKDLVVVSMRQARFLNVDEILLFLIIYLVDRFPHILLFLTFPSQIKSFSFFLFPSMNA